ncbi:MAG: DUF6597 domain-containing transcriptional factor [Syntrophobacteraceae bacterium]
MMYQEYLPHPALKEWVKCYWTLSMSAGNRLDEGLSFIAEGIEISFNFADPIALISRDQKTSMFSRDCICGPMTQPMRIQPTGNVELLGVCFRAGGGYPFFGCPANEFVNGSLRLEDFWGAGRLEIIAVIQENCQEVENVTAHLDDHFLDVLAKTSKTDPFIAAAVAVIESDRGRVEVDRVARSVGLSTRQLERRFKERVGMSPKELCRISRFKNVYKQLDAIPFEGWASTALACGYYDQSHMIRDFKHYVGASPAAYFSKPVAAGRLFTGNL